MNPFIRPWRHLFDFNGRASRTEYGLFHITAFGAYMVLFILPMAMFSVDDRGHAADPGPVAIGIMAILALLSMAVFFLGLIGHISVTVRRLHDQGEPWVKYLLTFIPLVGFIFYLMLVFTRGDDYENDYGPDPRQPEQETVEALGSVFS